MEKFFKLNKPVYHNADAIRVSVKYNKGFGYGVLCEVVELIPTDDGWLYGKLFCPEYYAMGGDSYNLIIKSSRRNTRKEADAILEVKERARQYAESYVRHIDSELSIIEEV